MIFLTVLEIPTRWKISKIPQNSKITEKSPPYIKEIGMKFRVKFEEAGKFRGQLQKNLTNFEKNFEFWIMMPTNYVRLFFKISKFIRPPFSRYGKKQIGGGGGGLKNSIFENIADTKNYLHFQPPLGMRNGSSN